MPGMPNWIAVVLAVGLVGCGGAVADPVPLPGGADAEASESATPVTLGSVYVTDDGPDACIMVCDGLSRTCVSARWTAGPNVGKVGSCGNGPPAGARLECECR